MIGRLIVTAAAVLTVIAIEELLQKSQFLYVLVMSGVLSFAKLLWLWLNILPLIFYHSIPEIISISIAFRYYMWTETNEIVALKNAGLSCFRIARPGLITTAFFTLFCGVNSLWLVSPTWSNVEAVRATAITNVNPDLLEPGYQQEIAPGLSVEFAHRLADGALADVVVFDSREAPQFRMLWAKTAQFLHLGNQLILRLDHGTYHIHNDERPVTTEYDSMSLPVGISGSAAEPMRSRGMYEQSILWLLDPPPQVRNDPRKYAEAATEGHDRIIAPLLCMGNGILMLGLLVPGYRGKRNQLWRMLIAFTCAIATNTLPAPLSTLAIDHPDILPYLYLQPLLPMVIGTALLIHGEMPLPAGLIARRLRWLGGAGLDQPLTQGPT